MIFRYKDNHKIISPLYVHRLSFRVPRLTEAERFLRLHHDTGTLKTTADKLRYYRYKKSLCQREVADYAGIERNTYINYEYAERDFYPPEKLIKLAECLEVDVYDLCDEYNRFLIDGQGRQIRELRKSRGLTQYEFAKLFNVTTSTVKRWESERITISKSTWQKLFLLDYCRDVQKAMLI